MYGRIEVKMCYMLPSFLATFNSFGHVETDFFIRPFRGRWRTVGCLSGELLCAFFSPKAKTRVKRDFDMLHLLPKSRYKVKDRWFFIDVFFTNINLVNRCFAVPWNRLCAMESSYDDSDSKFQVFWRPPMTSSSQFQIDQLQSPWGLVGRMVEYYWNMLGDKFFWV